MIKRFLTARGTVAVLFCLLTAAMSVTLVLPQREGATPPAWLQTSPALAGAAHWAGLDHVLGTWWFLALAVVFLLSLLFSTWDQYRLALRRTRQGGGESGGEPLLAERERFVAALRGLGYRELGPAGRLVKHPWGYWGNFFLHVGLALAILCSVVYISTENRVLVRLVTGEETYLVGDSFQSEKGLLARPLPLPEAVRLDELRPCFWETGQLKALESRISLIAREGRESHTLAVNDNLGYRGLLVYQRPTFGDAFVLRLADPKGYVTREVLYLPAHSALKTVYGESPVAEGRYLMKGKIAPTAAFPQTVTVRLLEGGKVLAEGRLAVGRETLLGPYRVVLERSAGWCEYLFEGSRGTMGIFAGFALILVGAFLTYFCVPSVVTLRPDGERLLVTWSSGRFSELNRGEMERIFALARGESVT